MINLIGDLRYIKLYRKRYKPPMGMTRELWSNVMRRYNNKQKDIRSSCFNWYVCSFDDGRRELMYLRVLHGGIFSGMYSAIYRGLIIPRMLDYHTFAHIKEIRLAF